MRWIAAAALIVFLSGPGDPAGGADGGGRTAVPAGTWGGQHAALVLGDSGGRIEFDCAHGTIDEPLAVDAQGRFDARGTYSREHGGPIRVEEREEKRPARYSGSVTGGTMSLTITVTGFPTAVGPYTLEHGKRGIIHKCL